VFGQVPALPRARCSAAGRWEISAAIGRLYPPPPSAVSGTSPAFLRTRNPGC